jgi:SPP1 family phage portal protein
LEQYKVQSIESITNELILSLVERYKIKEIPRLKKLDNYYLGKSNIKNRKMTDTSKPNNKIANPYGAYIVDTVQGYFLGKPVSYSSDNETLMEKLQLVYDRNHEQAHNSKVGKQLSITGIAYELMYMNEANEIKFAMLNPQEVFMIYDNSIETKPLMAVRFYEVHDYVSDSAVTHVEVYTDKMIHYYTVGEKDLVLTDEYPHYFGEVPVVCYLNNDDAMGDFEKVVDLIDAYDLAVSDTSNSLEYFADSYLVLTGMGGTEPSDIQAMKEQRVMLLDDNGKAEWLVKGSTDMQIEEFKNRIKEDIHSFSFVPNLNDDSFGSTTSGESLKYKLFGLENAVAIKERNFKRGLETRVRLITNILNIKGGSYAYTDVVMQFQRNLPTNSAQMADMITKLSGIVSQETLLSLLPFVDDPAFELAKLEKEKEDTMYENFNPTVDVIEE